MHEGRDGARAYLRDGRGQPGSVHRSAQLARDLVEETGTALAVHGYHVMAPATVRQCLGADDEVWRRFAAHWEDLALDAYEARRGTRRWRRYGCFSLARNGGGLTPLAHDAFVQPEQSNDLYGDMRRDFEPLTGAFAADPLLGALIRMLGQLAWGLEDTQVWTVRVHPFRVVAEAGGEGLPTPEGRHRDGGTLVASLLVDRDNAVGGKSTVYTAGGAELLSTTLIEPGTLLLGDDRATLHAVSPIRALDAGRPAHRDVLVTALAPG
ncbi:2OG-Fe dioxygenase family protein [Streptomyces sp. NPDC051214]|uniref:2OG-Fe dioxygenase family protein n=1 Tax=Streptomyces sp. NPDC051214 TaxID=3155282 RepID=UPI00343DE0A6